MGDTSVRSKKGVGEGLINWLKNNLVMRSGEDTTEFKELNEEELDSALFKDFDENKGWFSKPVSFTGDEKLDKEFEEIFKKFK